MNRLLILAFLAAASVYVTANTPPGHATISTVTGTSPTWSLENLPLGDSDSTSMTAKPPSPATEDTTTARSPADIQPDIMTSAEDIIPTPSISTIENNTRDYREYNNDSATENHTWFPTPCSIINNDNDDGNNIYDDGDDNNDNNNNDDNNNNNNNNNNNLATEENQTNPNSTATTEKSGHTSFPCFSRCRGEPEDSTVTPANGPETIADVRALMERTGLVPLALVGVVLNALALWVWQADRNYNATTFLFKYLACYDGACLLTLVIFILSLHPVLLVSLSISNVSQRVSVHTTLLVAVTRWMAVSRPLHVRSLLPAGRVRGACGVILCWCVLIEGLYLYSDLTDTDKETAWAIYYAQRVLGLALPLVLMVVVNVLLIVRSCRPRQGVGLTAQQQSMEARYRLTYATVCISVCAIVSYPVSIITETVTNIQCYDGNAYVCDRLQMYIIKFSTFVLQVLNLGVNFFFYAAFASRFRQLLADRTRHCCCGGRRDGGHESFAAVDDTTTTATAASVMSLPSVAGSGDFD